MPKNNRAVQQCPKLGSILFAVMKTDNTPISGAKVSVAGPTPGSASTDKGGFAEFPNRDPGDYTATVTLDKSGLKLLDYDPKLSVSKGSEAYGLAKAKAIGRLEVEVYDDLGKPVKEVVEFSISGTDSSTAPGNGQHQTQFEDLAEGLYTVSASFRAERFESSSASQADVKVPEGKTGKARLVVKIVNTAKPKISIDKREIKCGVEPPKNPPPVSPHIFLSKKGPTQKPAEVAKLSLSYEETRPEKPYKEDGLLTFAGTEVEAFKDQDCTIPLPNAAQGIRIPNAELKAGTTVYLRGKVEGNLSAELSLIQPANHDIRIAAPQQVALAIKQINIVEPKIEVEYKVVMLDRDLAKHQKKPDSKDGSGPADEADKVRAEPTYILLSAKQAVGGPRYTGGGKIELANVDVFKVFKDKQCKEPFDITQPLTHDQLFGPEPLKLYLRGKTAGKFTPKLTLDPSSDALIEVLGPAEGEMGVVELKLKVHHYKKAEVNKAVHPDVPDFNTYWDEMKGLALDQTAMTDAEKVTPGRMLHKQNAGSHARAKIILEKLDASQWPDGTDKYTLVLDQAKARDTGTGGLTLYDAETDGSKQDFPKKLEVSEAKAKEHTFWLEGSSTAEGWRDARFDVGLDRPKEGPDHEAKRNGDFGHFTVVEIEKVLLDYTPPVGKANAWDDGSKKFYINVKDDSAGEGRKITIGSLLKPKLDGVVIHHMLAPDQNNLKSANWGIDKPGTWAWETIDKAVKHEDKDDRQKLLHKSAETKTEAAHTDATLKAGGYAKTELKLSRFGGDIFQPAAYIDQDPHLAKYVHGHADLAKRKPVFCSHTITVWRKFWYRVVKVEGINPPGFGVAEGQYTTVKSTMEAGPELAVTRATVNGYNPKAIYPMHMVRLNGGNGDALVISDTNKAQFFVGYAAAADRPVEVPIVVCDAQWDAGGDSGVQSGWNLATAFPFNLTMDKLVLTPPLQGGGLYVSGTWTAAESDGSGGWTNVRNGNLSNADLSVDPNRTDLHAVNIALPAGVGPTTPNTNVWINNLVVQGADGPFLGESFAKKILAVYDPTTPLNIADFQNTIAHEIGHAFEQVIVGDPAGGIAGLPKHPNQYLSRGSHCNTDVNKCVMFASGPIVGSHNRYCDVCHPYLLVQRMDKIK